MKNWTGDDACPAPLCMCDESFAIDGKPTKEFLVCKGTSGSSDPYAPTAGHTVVYLADKGKLRVVLDLETLLFPDGPNQGGVLALSHAITEKHEIVFTDESPPGGVPPSRCTGALAAIDDMLRANHDALLQQHRDAYAAMCNARGTYAFAGARFKKTR